MKHIILIKEESFLDISLKNTKFLITLDNINYKNNDIINFDVLSKKDGIYRYFEPFIIDNIIRESKGLKKGFCILILDNFALSRPKNRYKYTLNDFLGKS